MEFILESCRSAQLILYIKMRIKNNTYDRNFNLYQHWLFALYQKMLSTIYRKPWWDKNVGEVCEIEKISKLMTGMNYQVKIKTLVIIWKETLQETLITRVR